MNKQEKIQNIISQMTLEQKVGQCLVIGFVGTMITPEILRRIREYNPAGIRVGLTFRVKSADYDPYAYNAESLHKVIRKPHGTIKDFVKGIPVPYCTSQEYCHFLNTLKNAAKENGLGIPLHITLDMEGDASTDFFRDGIQYLPSQMGIAKSGDKRLAYDAAWAAARQLTPIGFSWIHSPVLDVNTNPNNPEIGTRSFSADEYEATAFALEALKGYRDGGLITTGKHFPGRGASSQDAHGDLPVIDIPMEEVERHLIPFKALIDAGLPAIMTAHTVYPALDPDMPATLSKLILTDLLKNKMGFKGAVTTDDITMGGIVKRFEVYEACILALNAGADLILFRDESSLIDEVFPKLVDAVRTGIIPEERINDAITRTLGVKYDYGLFEDGGIKDETRAREGIADPKVAQIVRRAAQKTVGILRNDANTLPLKKSDRILLIEQVHPLHEFTNDQRCHPCLLWEKMLEHSENISIVETTMGFDQNSQDRVKARLEQDFDVIVVTNFYFRRYSNGNAFVQNLRKYGKPIVLVTNTHHAFTIRPDDETVVINYGASPESYEEVAKLLFGKQ